MDLPEMVGRVMENVRASKAIFVPTVICVASMAMLVLPSVSPNWDHMGWIARSLGLTAVFVLWISTYRMMR